MFLWCFFENVVNFTDSYISLNGTNVGTWKRSATRNLAITNKSHVGSCAEVLF